MSAPYCDPREPRGWCQTEFSDGPLRQMGELRAYRFPLKPRLLTATAVTRLSETLVRVRFTSNDSFKGFHTLSPTDHVKLFFDQKKDGTPLLPRLIAGRWSARDKTFRDYTVRWFDPHTKELDIDFVLHDHGPAGRWAINAKPGDQLAVLGPRGAIVYPDVFPWYVFAVDETALPALARWLEGLRPGVPVTAFVEVDGPASHITLPTRADLTLTWCDRNGQAPGNTLLADAMAQHTFPDRDGFVWVAGEAGSLKPIRRQLKELGFDREHADIDGYWRVGVSNLDHHAE